MKKNIYYQDVLQRKNPLTKALAGYFMSACSWPRMLLEVFIRKNFGERYFSLSMAIIATVILATVPIAKSLGMRYLVRYLDNKPFDIFDFLYHDLTWYCFLAGFIAMCIDRQIEIQRQPNVFDFGRFSKSSGHIHPFFFSLSPFGKPLSQRTIETLVEPGYFFIIGVVLWLLQQHVGILITICSIFYCLSYRLAYHQGDHFIMDQIDELICNQELTNAFIDGLRPDQTRGFTMRARKPVDLNDRRAIADNLIVDSDIAVVL